MEEVYAGVEFEEGVDRSKHLNFLSYNPCMFKNTYKEGLESVLKAYRMKTGRNFSIFGPMGCGECTEDLYAGIWKVSHIDDFPDAVTSMGFSDFFRKGFIERFVQKGCFQNVWEGPVNKPFEDAGLIDPDGWYTVYSVIPFVMLVDMKKLGDLPMPKQWCDLLAPQFKDNVILCGSRDQISDAPLLYFYKAHGEEGIGMLAANVKNMMSPAESAKTAGSSNPGGAAVYVLPWIFARSCPRTEMVSVVWPEDGALVNPVYLLVKKDKIKEVSPVIDYTLGVELGRQSAQSCFPVINPQVDNGLPQGASFKWLGWDYIKTYDTVELKELTQTIFFSAWNKAHGKDKK